MPALLLTTDLATSSKVSAAAARQGTRLAVAMSVEALCDKAAAEGFDIAILDLSAAGLDVRALVRRLRALPAPPRAILAFGPHVHESLLAAAREAGCDAVVSRGQFHAQVDRILAGEAAS
ncbi:MAG: response regulator transcription factor [Planctomycetia bacterium]|nr:response regulator transcription factor [Planctomycetia bacterium]